MAPLKILQLILTQNFINYQNIALNLFLMPLRGLAPSNMSTSQKNNSLLLDNYKLAFSTRDSGMILKEKDMEDKYGEMDQSMKECGQIIWLTEKEG